jgi:zinc protease
VTEFFKKYYAPGNASLVIAGDIKIEETRKKVEYWFSDVPAGVAVEPLKVRPAELSGVITETLTDRVQLPRMFLSWLTPAHFAPGDAELDVVASVLTGGKNSRLYKRLVYDLQLAQDVTARQHSWRYGSWFTIDVTARPSAQPPTRVLEQIKTIVDEEIEKVRNAPPAPREVDRARNGIESTFLSGMEVVASKADQLNAYYFATGDPDYFAKDLARYHAIAPDDVRNAVRRWLPAGRRLELSVLPAAAGKGSER